MKYITIFILGWVVFLAAEAFAFIVVEKLEDRYKRQLPVWPIHFTGAFAMLSTWAILSAL